MQIHIKNMICDRCVLEHTLGEIADKLGYSNVQYLSGQFRKVIGFTSSHYKRIKENKRIPLDKITR